MNENTTREVAEQRFYLRNDEYALRLDDATISWSACPSKSAKAAARIIVLEDTLAVCSANNDHYFCGDQHRTDKKSNSLSSRSVSDVSDVKSCHSFEIHFVTTRLPKCRVETVKFCHSDLTIVTTWIDALRSRIEKAANRPKSLLVFVNPLSGRKRGLEIYRKFAEPLFRLMGVKVTLVTTQRTNHSRDYIVENGWHNVDGIVTVGGDGTFLEVMNGVIVRTAKNSRVDLDDSRAPIPSPAVALGVIPAGSTDGLAYSLHGTADIQTAVVHVINGNYMKTDICSVRTDKKFLCCFIGLMSYGYLGDIIKNSESLRWMGPMRYDCVGARFFFFHKSYEGTVTFIKETDGDTEQSICLKNDCSCVRQTNKTHFDDDKKVEMIRGEFFMVTAANTPCASSRSPNGMAPLCHLADGYFHLLLVRRVSFCEKLKLLLTVSNKRKSVNNLDFVDIYKTRGFKFETGYGSGIIPATKISSWNVDGELVQNPHLYVRDGKVIELASSYYLFQIIRLRIPCGCYFYLVKMSSANNSDVLSATNCYVKNQIIR